MSRTGNFIKRIPVHLQHQELGIPEPDVDRNWFRATHPFSAGTQSQTSNTATTEGGEQPAPRTDRTADDYGMVPGGTSD